MQGHIQGLGDRDVFALPLISHRYEWVSDLCPFISDGSTVVSATPFTAATNQLVVAISPCNPNDQLAPWTFTLTDLGP
ncbi:MAG: hypothetical protein U0228_14030 [Myxococcaceae bacterium]